MLEGRIYIVNKKSKVEKRSGKEKRDENEKKQC